MRNKQIISYFISFTIIFLYTYIFFNSFLFSSIFSIFISLKFYKNIYEIFEKKNLRLKRIMFREFLDIFNSNIISGENFYNSLKKTSKEIKNIFHDNTYLVKYLDELVLDIENGKNITDALRDFKQKADLEEVDIFIDSLILSIQMGIDLSKITNNSKNMLSDNISLELELSTIVDNSKKEFLIMIFLPIFVLLLVNNSSTNTLRFSDYLIRIPVFISFIFAFYLGNKIVNLEV